jgi:predicted enzyme related to lactoylglutathione lyase
MAAGPLCKSKGAWFPAHQAACQEFSKEISRKTSRHRWIGGWVVIRFIANCGEAVMGIRYANKTRRSWTKHQDRLSESIRVSSWSMQLRSAILYVKDLERMKRFYREMFGTGRSNQRCTDAWATFETGGACFSLHAIPAEIAKRIDIQSPPIPPEEQPVKLIFEVTAVELERVRLESLGIQILRRPWQKPGEACDAVDPESNVFQICARLQGAMWTCSSTLVV